MNEQATVTTEPIETVMDGTELKPVEKVTPVETEPQEKPKTHIRAGFTTHKGLGTSKARRKMAAKSRRINRSK